MHIHRRLKRFTNFVIYLVVVGFRGYLGELNYLALASNLLTGTIPTEL
jgi:hypothetical protein